MVFATKISDRFCFIVGSTARVVFCFAAILVAGSLRAETNSFAARAEQAFAHAEQFARQQPTNTSALVGLAHAAYDWADFSRTDDARADIAQRGITAARQAVALSPSNAVARYWLGMDLGQLAQTKLLGALKLVREMEEEFLLARALDEHVDFAGSDRSLGYLYRDAPGWPTSLGSKKKAREHMQRAVELHPEFPDNQLALVESYEKWGDKNSFQRQLKIAEQVLADAPAKFNGPQWDQSWADWRQRLVTLKSKSGDMSKPVTTKGPR